MWYVENKAGATTLSKYEYALDTVGRRTSVLMTGEAFNDGTGNRHWEFLYNKRSELTNGDRRQGTTLGSGTFMTPGDFDYAYDPIGNRTESNVDGASPAMSYTANNVNQYTATANPAKSLVYDDDGNLTDETKPGPYILSAKSMKVHGTAGWFGITLLLVEGSAAV